MSAWGLGYINVNGSRVAHKDIFGNLCKKLFSLYRLQCKGDIVVVDIKQHKSQFNNSNFTITQSAKFFRHFCRGRQEKREGTESKRSRKRYTSPIRGKPPWTNFHQILHIRKCAGRIICANFGSAKLRGLGYMGYTGVKFWVWVLGSPIEMAGHLYNSAALPRSAW